MLHRLRHPSRLCWLQLGVVGVIAREREAANNIQAIACAIETVGGMDALADLGNIPAEYAAVQNPAIHLAMLESDAKRNQKAKKEAGLTKAAVQTKLETFVAKLSDSPKEAVSVTETNFQEQVDLLEKWYNILDVFQS